MVTTDHRLNQRTDRSTYTGFTEEKGQWIVDTDASDTGLGAVLSQVQNKKERVIMFGSRSLSKPERNYCVTQRELLAVVFAIRKLRHYLSQRFTIRTDHSSLRWLLASRRTDGTMAPRYFNIRFRDTTSAWPAT